MSRGVWSVAETGNSGSCVCLLSRGRAGQRPTHALLNFEVMITNNDTARTDGDEDGGEMWRRLTPQAVQTCYGEVDDG